MKILKLHAYSYLLLISLVLLACNNDPVRPNPTVSTKQLQSPNQEETIVTTEPKQSKDTSPRDRLRFKTKEKDVKVMAMHLASAVKILND